MPKTNSFKLNLLWIVLFIFSACAPAVPVTKNIVIKGTVCLDRDKSTYCDVGEGVSNTQVHASLIVNGEQVWEGSMQTNDNGEFLFETGYMYDLRDDLQLKADAVSPVEGCKATFPEEIEGDTSITYNLTFIFIEGPCTPGQDI